MVGITRIKVNLLVHFPLVVVRSPYMSISPICCEMFELILMVLGDKPCFRQIRKSVFAKPPFRNPQRDSKIYRILSEHDSTIWVRWGLPKGQSGTSPLCSLELLCWNILRYTQCLDSISYTLGCAISFISGYISPSVSRASMATHIPREYTPCCNANHSWLYSLIIGPSSSISPYHIPTFKIHWIGF